MDDLHLRECQSLVEQAKRELTAKEYQSLIDFSYVDIDAFKSAEKKCHRDKIKAVIAYHRLLNKDRVDETLHKTHEWLTEIIKWLCFPFAAPKKWGLIYAVDMPRLHDERTPAETAKKIGCTRAAISVQMQDFAKTFKLTPSRWMRDDDAVENSRKARNDYCEENEP